MNVTLDPRSATLITEILARGGYASAADVVQESLRVLAEREAALAALRATIEASIAAGGSNSADDVETFIRTEADKRRATP